MPIGKNAIKRITNNGYSNVQASAPDMENSVVEEKIKIVEKKTAEEKIAVKKATPKTSSKASDTKKATTKAPTVKVSAPKKSLEKEPALSPIKTAEKVTKKAENEGERQGEGYINLGGKLPVHLL